MTWRADIDGQARRVGLFDMGVLHDAGDTLMLLGLAAGGWDVFRKAPEALDGAAHALDRWSERVVTTLAEAVGARTEFPFGGPPYAPFMSWALKSGECWQSPVGMLVHHTAGLMISFRGALRVPGHLDVPEPAISPCEQCDAPCRTACPVEALGTDGGYNVGACHGFLDTGAGRDCLDRGCKARRICPVSDRFGRQPEQSAFHMAAFHPRH